MAVVYHDVRAPSLIVGHVDAFQPFPVDLSPVDGTPQPTVTQHAEAKEGKGDPFGEEYFANIGGHEGECMPNAANDNVLEQSGSLNEWRSPIRMSEVSLLDQLIREDAD